jgi:hypothetical protein
MSALEEAYRMLKTENLNRSEKFIGPIEWLIELNTKLNAAKNKKLKNNILWLHVAKAPAGFCHIKGSMVGTLLQDIMDGYSFQDIQKRFGDKTRPEIYQRPQAAPAAGNVATAERIFEKLEAADSLKRRFAKLNELKLFWSPPIRKVKRGTKSTGGVFSGLETKEKAPAPRTRTRRKALPPQTMTWVKFQSKVLPEAERIEYLVPDQSERFAAMVTAVNPEATPIIQWDNMERRNPFSWYLYIHATSARQWNLVPYEYVNVVGMCLSPHMWYGDYSHLFAGSMMFILEGCQDSQNNSLALFPEILKSDFHQIRATIESYSRSRKLGVLGPKDAGACGLWLSGKTNWTDMKFRVTTRDGMVSEYILDRWD